MTILMLQTFTVQRCPARGCADQETLTLHIPRRPGKVTNALEAKH